MSEIQKFYLMDETCKAPYRLQYILFQFNSNDWEDNHDFIQWVFPNKEPSQFNPNAPILTDEDIAFLKQKRFDYRITMLFEKFVNFLGYRRHYKWNRLQQWCYNTIEYRVKAINHNQLRITRLIKFLKLLEKRELLDILYHALVREDVQGDAKFYWTEAYHG